ncbi:MAG: DUF4760 domain-containing protein [Planctomycetota bacterium]
MPIFEDAQLALTLYELRRESEMRKARAMVGARIAGAPWEKVEKLLEYDHPENAHLRQVAGYWEMAASFVNRGIFHPAVYLDTCGEGIFTLWAFRPHLERIRSAGRPRFLVETEKLVTTVPALHERLELIDRSMAQRAAAEAARKAAKKAKKEEKKRKRA